MREAIKLHKQQQTIINSPNSSYAAIAFNSNESNKNTISTVSNNGNNAAFTLTQNNNNKDTSNNLLTTYNTSNNLAKTTENSNNSSKTSENSNNSSNISSLTDRTNFANSPTTNPSSLINVPSAINTNEYKFPSYSPSSNIAYNSTKLNEIDAKFTTNQLSSKTTAYSHSPLT